MFHFYIRIARAVGKQKQPHSETRTRKVVAVDGTILVSSMLCVCGWVGGFVVLVTKSNTHRMVRPTDPRLNRLCEQLRSMKMKRFVLKGVYFGDARYVFELIPVQIKFHLFHWFS